MEHEKGVMKVYLTTNEAVMCGYFSTAQAAANLRYRKEGPPYFKVGKKVLYKTDDLEKHMEKRRVLTKESIAVKQKIAAFRRTQ